MADETKTILIDVEVEAKDFNEEIGKVNSQLRANREEIKELSKNYDENSTEIAKLEASNRDLSKSKQGLIKESKTESNSLDALRLRVANLTKERNKQDTSTKEGRKRFAELNKEIKGNTDQIKKAEQAGGDYRRSVGDYGTALDRVIPGLSGVTSGIGATTKAALAFIATPLGAILGAIGLAIGAVTAAFKGSEEGQIKFAKLTGAISSVLGNLQDLLHDLGMVIIDFFENPLQGIEDLGNAIKDNLVTRFDGLLNLIPSLSEAVELLFKGKFGQAGKVAADALGQVVLGTESVTDSFTEATEAVTGFFAEVEQDSKDAIKIAGDLARAEQLERELLIDRARIEGEVAELKLKAREDDKFSAEERKRFIEEANELEGAVIDRQKEILQIRADAIVLQNTLSESTTEDLRAEAEAIAAVERVEAERFTKQKANLRDLDRINAELEKEEIARDKAEEKRQEEELKQAKKIADEKAKLLKKEADNEITLANLKRRLGQVELEDLASFFKSTSKLGKTFALIQIGQDTAKAISAMTAREATKGLRGIVTASIGIAKILNNIRRAKNILNSSGGGGNFNVPDVGGSVDVNAGLTSSFAQQSNIADQQGQAFAAAQQQAPIFVSVVDINTAQSARTVKVAESQLG